ncbi:MAG: hypothetical protein WCK34_00450 [Bacteroidota bacterium]
MKSAYLKFLKQLLVFSGILAAIFVALLLLLPKNYLSPALPSLFFFFIATSLLSFYYLLQTIDKRFIRFVNTFLLTIIIKLMLYAAVMILYVLVNRKDAVPFMLGFFVLYLCYTVFESVCIIKNSSPAPPDSPIN